VDGHTAVDSSVAGKAMVESLEVALARLVHGRNDVEYTIHTAPTGSLNLPGWLIVPPPRRCWPRRALERGESYAGGQREISTFHACGCAGFIVGGRLRRVGAGSNEHEPAAGFDRGTRADEH
jgi:hypothetical protein